MAAIDLVDWKNPFSYIREIYGVPAHEGRRVWFNGKPHEIVGAEGAYLRIAPYEKGAAPILVHPTWRIDYGATS